LIYFKKFKKISGLSNSIGDYLQEIMPSRKEAALLILIMFSFVCTEVKLATAIKTNTFF